MSDEQARLLWVTVYAAVMSGLAAGVTSRNWESIRERAEIEANIALRAASGVNA